MAEVFDYIIGAVYAGIVVGVLAFNVKSCVDLGKASLEMKIQEEQAFQREEEYQRSRNRLIPEWTERYQRGVEDLDIW